MELGAPTPQQLQIAPLRFAPAGMTRGGQLRFRKVSDLDGQGYERLLCEDRRSLHYSHALSLAVLELTLYEVSYLPNGETVAFKIYGQLPSAVDDDGVE
jgi:hypothetical protein